MSICGLVQLAWGASLYPYGVFFFFFHQVPMAPGEEEEREPSCWRGCGATNCTMVGHASIIPEQRVDYNY